MQIEIVTKPIGNGRYSIQMQFKYPTYIDINCESKNAMIDFRYVIGSILEFIYPNQDINIRKIYYNTELVPNKITCSLVNQCRLVNEAIENIKYGKSCDLIHDVYININKNKDLMMIHKQDETNHPSTIKIPLSYKNDKDKLIEGLHSLKNEMLKIDETFKDIIYRTNIEWILLRRVKFGMGYIYQSITLIAAWNFDLKNWYLSTDKEYVFGEFRYIKKEDDVNIYFNDVLIKVKNSVFERIK